MRLIVVLLYVYIIKNSYVNLKMNYMMELTAKDMDSW